MRTCRIPDLVDSFHHRIHRRIVTDRIIRAVKIIIDRSGYPHNRHIMFLYHLASPGKSSVTPDNYQGIYTMLFQTLVSLSPSFRCPESFALAVFNIVPPVV